MSLGRGNLFPEIQLLSRAQKRAYSDQHPTCMILLIKQSETEKSFKYGLNLSLTTELAADLHPSQRSTPISPLLPLLSSQSSQWEVSSLPIDQLDYEEFKAGTYIGS